MCKPVKISRHGALRFLQCWRASNTSCSFRCNILSVSRHNMVVPQRSLQC